MILGTSTGNFPPFDQCSVVEMARSSKPDGQGAQLNGGCAGTVPARNSGKMPAQQRR
jgi:hypothetical protein